MSASSATVPLQQMWTFEDLQALPEDVDWRRYEIVDGALVVSPGPALDHEFVIGEIRAVIMSALPAGFKVVGPITVDLHPSYRIPDLVVLPLDAFRAGGKLARPDDVLLAVEVVSPGSVTTDRITKPAQYAAAGIGAYWRVETQPEVSLAAYVLRGGESVYAELGTWVPGQIAHVGEPFHVEITISDLVPPS